MKKYFFLLGLILLFVTQAGIATAQTETAQAETVVVHMFGREDCGFCKKQIAFFEQEGIVYEYLNVVDDEDAAALFKLVAEKHDIARVTPLTIIGETVIQGFNSPETTGKAIIEAITNAEQGSIFSVEEHILHAPKQDVLAGEGCDENGIECNIASTQSYIFDLPFIGLVDMKSFSLVTLSLVLGTIDGFNPCAMWVLITFLVLLSQAGSRRKMIFLAGIFIVAEAVMYNLILNVWYKTWNFVALDQIVTPLVGVLALGGGLFFLYRWHKNKNTALVCDISDIESQSKTIGKFKAIAQQPLTVTTVMAIIVIAFSVNIIEFACSIGIPQAYTKILDLNMLSFAQQQLYILIYTFGYMLDDFLVFGLAIWGYSKLEAHGHKYSQLSLLIGGVLMFILGAILIANPDILVL